MTYPTAAASRRVLEARLVTESAKTGTPLVRLRKPVVFERFLARLMRACPHDWLLKGGLALQFRMGKRSYDTRCGCAADLAGRGGAQRRDQAGESIPAR